MLQLALLDGLRMPELIFIFGAVLIIFGPKSLPGLGRALGQGISEFKRATNRITDNIAHMDEEDAPPARPAVRQRAAAVEAGAPQTILAQPAVPVTATPIDDQS
ncbi:hypothetical protein BH09SUM1_BH09SUM1_28200 [soil metagenome]